MEQRAHLYTLAGVCALPRAHLRTGNFPRAPIWRLCRNKGLHPLRRLRGYPCTPTKTVHPLARLYYFCGFYYPVREVIPIAIYHCNIGIVSRGKGKSAVAAAAYRSGEKITNEWDGMPHDYTRKRGVVHTEILLPPHAPPSFSDRATLWNSVELYEKAGNAQLAREIDAALPIELSREEQIRLVREYCSSQFVSRGMCVDFAIHDTDSGNPHCHIMLTMRPLDERGAWAAKSKKEYDLDENGERIRLPSGRYKTHKVDLTGWNDKGNALLWRKAWADADDRGHEEVGAVPGAQGSAGHEGICRPPFGHRAGQVPQDHADHRCPLAGETPEAGGSAERQGTGQGESTGFRSATVEPFAGRTGAAESICTFNCGKVRKSFSIVRGDDY